MKGLLQLEFPIHTLNNELLFSEGDTLSTKSLNALIRSHKGTDHRRVAVLAYGELRKDLFRFLEEDPYPAIFGDRKTIDRVLKSLESLELPLPILESLDYFRKEDPCTYVHILRVFALSSLIALGMAKHDSSLRMETIAGHAHDFGKICVPLDILKKAEPLTASERRCLEHHALAGYALLSFYMKDTKSFLAQVAKEHHERRDGSGYPLGIPLKGGMVEIIAVCDIYDALVSIRPYRKEPYDNRTALEVITEMAGKGSLGMEPVKALIAENRTDKPAYADCIISREKRGKPPRGNVYGILVEEDD